MAASGRRRAKRMVAEYRARLTRLDRDREFRFRDTTRRRARAYLRDTTRIVGCREAEIRAREAAVGARFPEVFRAYLGTFGRSGGRLFRGSEVGLARHDALRREAEGLLAESTANGLPEDAEVFWTHQGYQFMYVVATGGFDGPVWLYTEGEPAPRVVHDSFAELLEAEAALCEDNHGSRVARGGMWVTVDERGFVHEQHPSRNSGLRPLNGPDRYAD